MDGDKIKKKLLNYARDYAFEKINKTLDKKLANSNGKHSPNEDDVDEADEPLRSSIGGRPHTATCKRMTMPPRSSRHLEPIDNRRSTIEDEVVMRSHHSRRPRVHLTRDQRNRNSRVRSDGDSCLEGDEGDEDEMSTVQFRRQPMGRQRNSAVASVPKHNQRVSHQSLPQSRARSERGSGGGLSQISIATPTITSQGEWDAIICDPPCGVVMITQMDRKSKFVR